MKIKSILWIIAISIGSSCTERIYLGSSKLLEKQHITYDHDRTLRLMLLANHAYDDVIVKSKDYEKIKKVLTDRIKGNGQTEKYELIWLGVDRRNANLTYVVRSKSPKVNILSVISRGTVLSLTDIKEDLEVQLVPWRKDIDQSSDIRISKGIRLALNHTENMQSQIFGEPNAKAVTLMELFKTEVENNGETVIYFSGHSLGGDISTVLALSTLERFEDFTLQKKLGLVVYNFAGQTPGNDHFKKYYNGLLSDKSIMFSYHRIINPYDVIPYAFYDLEKIKKIYPYSKSGLIETEIFLETLNLFVKNKKYAHVGADPINLPATLPPLNCKDVVSSLKDFKCWTENEHQLSYYIELLKSWKD